jgi:hypothetical protein
MEKFKTTYGDSITKYEVIKETEKQITFIHKWTDWNKKEQSRELRENKDSTYHKWHDTFEDAKNYLIEYNKNKISNLENQITKAKEVLSKVQSLNCA